jgi:murein L,D-transpeptidase YcbB/YkuD
VLELALAAGEIQKQLDRQAPSTESYRSLQVALRRYRQIARSGGWPVFPEPMDIENLNTDQSQLLMQRLALTGDLDPGMKVLDAVYRFQHRHGLKVDGIVGKHTIAALSMPAEHRVSQIEWNLERLRWMPRENPPRSVEVNIPGLDLRMYESATMILTMQVIAGKPSWCTPTFLSSGINEIVLNPYWYVPSVIAQREIYPLLKRDPAYLQRNNIRIIRGTNGEIQLRQSPGPRNSLGRIKFLFPNCCDCYLHDTPEKHLFDQWIRFFSHGCIRVENAFDLAAWILENEGWSEEKLAADIESGKTVKIALADPVPIFLTYFTAWVDRNGLVQFRSDVYGKDRELSRTLSAP